MSSAFYILRHLSDSRLHHYLAMKSGLFLISLVILILMGINSSIEAQPVSVCEDSEFDLSNYVTQEFPACNTDSIVVINTGVSGISLGEYTSPVTPISDGSITVELYELGVLCATEIIQFDLIESDFTASFIPGSCNEINVIGPINDSACITNYVIGGQTYPGPDLIGLQLPNSGEYIIQSIIQCGGCVSTSIDTLDVDGPSAGFTLSSPSVFFDSVDWVICDGITGNSVEILDASSNLSGGSIVSSIQIDGPNGFSASASSLPFSFVPTELGPYTITYTIDDNGCLLDFQDNLFVYNQFETLALSADFQTQSFVCETESYFFDLCAGGCDNPEGTVYTVKLSCDPDFEFTTMTVPALVEIPLNVSSCGQGNCGSSCACVVIVTAETRCATNFAEATLCPLNVVPEPDATFDVLPEDDTNTYCTGELITFEPVWNSIDCNGFDPTPSSCEIQNAQWSVVPDVGYTVQPGSSLTTHPLEISFNTPGEYEITLEWSNSCTTAQYSETVCILPDAAPPINWLDSPIYCVGQTISPSINLPSISCLNADIEWTASDLIITNPNSISPTVEFSQTGSVELELAVDGLCNDLNEFITYTICDEPELILTQNEIELCVGQEFCFDQLVSLNWNNCLGDFTWEIDSLPGMPIQNPTGTDLCFTWDSGEELEFYIEAENDCGIVYDTLSVVITAAPSCPIQSPGDFCIGDQINIAPPVGADPASIQWFSSSDNGTTFNPLAGGMPTSPSSSTQYYLTALVNGCFCISDTVEASLIPEPNLIIEVSNLTPCPGDSIFLTTQPLLGDLNWDDGNESLLTDTVFIEGPDDIITYDATFNYGTVNTQCSVTDNITINPIVNPLSITCNLPATICEGDDALPLPIVSPSGGTKYITDSNGNTVLTNVDEIDPALLIPSSYYFVYEILESSCTFKDSCAFTITAPASPEITPVTDTLCYDQVIDFDDLNGLGGSWSSTCASSIDNQGVFNPSAAGCLPGSDVEITYSGNCILNETVSIHLIEIPTVSIIQDIAFPCPGDLVNFSVNPTFEDVNWIDGSGNILGTGPSIDLQIDEPISLVADVNVGVTTLSCFTQATLDVNPEVNPINIDCSVFPPVWCTGDDPISIPETLPGGGITTIVDESGNILITDPNQIETEILGSGIFYYVYEITQWGAGNCTFRDSCQFLINEPAIPIFEETPDSICYNSVFNFNELSGLSGQWSSSCLGSIDETTGILDPTAANCLPGSDLEIIYSGACIQNDTLSVHLISLPEISIELPQEEVCANDCLPFSQTINGSFESYEWNITWADQELNFVNENPVFCPDEVGINENLTVTVGLSVQTDSNPVCSVSATDQFEVIGIPNEVFNLPSPQCIASAVSLPECQNCESYQIDFQSDFDEFSCALPGENCAPPDTGVYQFDLIYNFGSCQSDTVNGAVHIVDIPFLTILESEYDTCAPVVDYSVIYGGYDYSLSWQTSGNIIQTTPQGENQYQTTIDLSEEVEVDTLYTDIVTVSNLCGMVTETSSIFHAANPDFTLDPDSALYCQGQSVFLDIGFAQPIHVDSILIAYNSIEGSDQIALYEIPEQDLPFDFDSDADTLEVTFTVSAFNSCESISKVLTAFNLPTDVSADFDIPFSPPVCVGDSIPIVFNSSGNVDLGSRQIETDNPNVEVLQVLGNWYLIPQQGFDDGSIEVELTEFGFCGVDFDQEAVVLGPSLNPSISSNDVCRGERVTLSPVLEQDAELSWQITPDSILVTDFPPSILYTQPGVYFPSVIASAEGFCDGTYVDTVEVFEPQQPILICDADCDDSKGCKVSFDNSSICLSLQSPELFNTYEWYVRERFFPGDFDEIEVLVDDIFPCKENLVRFSARDQNGCLVEARENIEFTDVLIYIPNAFSPNGDGFNDVFKPVITGEPVEYSLKIFDRWGKIVFETTDQEKSWRGNIDDRSYYADVEIYSYIMEFLPCQPKEGETKEKRSGMITLLR